LKGEKVFAKGSSSLGPTHRGASSRVGALSSRQWPLAGQSRCVPRRGDTGLVVRVISGLSPPVVDEAVVEGHLLVWSRWEIRLGPGHGFRLVWVLPQETPVGRGHGIWPRLPRIVDDHPGRKREPGWPVQMREPSQRCQNRRGHHAVRH